MKIISFRQSLQITVWRRTVHQISCLLRNIIIISKCIDASIENFSWIVKKYEDKTLKN
jgi:hypothetical protein